MKLAEIQQSLRGASAGEMCALVGLPVSVLEQLHNSVGKAASRRRTAFWAERPNPSVEAPAFKRVWQLELAPGVTVSLDEKLAAGLNEKEREELARALHERWRKQQEKRTKENP